MTLTKSPLPEPIQEGLSIIGPGGSRPDESVLDTFNQGLPDTSTSVAVIGAGVAGSTCAHFLNAFNLDIDVFEKARGSGGRCSTRRRTDECGKPVHFDHGAQYFTVRTDPFERFVNHWLKDGCVQEWKPTLGVYENGVLKKKSSDTKRYVSVPKMSRLAGELLDDLDPSFETRVDSLTKPASEWELISDQGQSFGPYDGVVLTSPAPQTADLLETVEGVSPSPVRAVEMEPVWATLVAFPERLPTDPDAIFVNEGPLDWSARNSSKPGRPDRECWVLHATSEWSRNNIEQPPEAVSESMKLAFESILPFTLPPTTYCSAHRWRYARTPNDRSSGHLQNDGGSLMVCGDWLGGSRIEGAFTSGRSGAGALLDGIARHT